jgi:hypothetical protein
MHIQTDLAGGFVKYAVEMGSNAVIYIPSFIKTGSAIQILMGGSRTHRGHGNRISFYFLNEESMLKMPPSDPL